jgi:hypothetical protein
MAVFFIPGFFRTKEFYKPMGALQSFLVPFFPATWDLMPFRKHYRNFDESLLPESTVNFIAEKEIKIWPRRNNLLKNHLDIMIPDTNHDSILFNDDFTDKAAEFLKAEDNLIRAYFRRSKNDLVNFKGKMKEDEADQILKNIGEGKINKS